MDTATAKNGNENTNNKTYTSPPKRFIYTQADMQNFRSSPTKRDLLSFVTALGRGCINAQSYDYDPSNPLFGLSPGMASLHGSLRCMAETWLVELPPDETVKARFGNPAFREWNKRLEGRSEDIVRSVMNCHRRFTIDGEKKQTNGRWDMSVLEQCQNAGYEAASKDNDAPSTAVSETEQEQRVRLELKCYLHLSFGHPIRLDYGTGHESSFFVLLYSLCKLGVFGADHTSTTTAPSANVMAPVALSIVSQYLEICRGIQKDYMLEPAGSHGVWGLDDYHCIPFYIGACQFQNTHHNSSHNYTPESIHNDNLLKSNEGDKYMYFGCIRYIKTLKKGVPFFESSPMLDDISHLHSWAKVSGGLLRLYEGEVLDKMPVVQHFLFGDIFKATWKASEVPREAPARTFINDPVNEECVAPWTQKRPGTSDASSNSLPPPTRAPWAK